MAKYIVLPNSSNGYREYNVPNPIKLQFGERYDGWKDNAHHFTTKYHRECLFPALQETLNFEMDRSKYNLIERHSGKFDLSYLAPNGEMNFRAYCINDGSTSDNLNYDDLTTNPYYGSDLTDYHRLFRFGHKNAMIENLSKNNGRTLLISCDSQMIPSTPLLCSIFKKVWHIDNRYAKDNIWSHIKDEEFTDVLIELCWTDLNHYLVENFKVT